MVSEQLKRAESIRRKQSIPSSQRTDGRDKAAEVIEDMWPSSLSDIADATEYSRQHIANTLEAYFEPADKQIDTTIDIPLKDIDTDELTLQFTVNISLDDDED